jgi:hypothetical protein
MEDNIETFALVGSGTRRPSPRVLRADDELAFLDLVLFRALLDALNSHINDISKSIFSSVVSHCREKIFVRLVRQFLKATSC